MTRGVVVHRLGSPAAGNNRAVGRQRVRMLRIYLSATTFLYSYGVVFTLFPVRTDLEYGNPVGGIIAIAVGVLGLLQLVVKPDRFTPATWAAIAATPIVMAFHVTITAEYVCLIAPMFLAMYIRAFHPTRRAWTLIAVLTAACVLAVAIAPAPHVGVITFLIITVAITGAAESFGLLVRAMFTAACTDPLTGLLNRAGWEIETTDLLARHRATPVAVTVVALNIDGPTHGAGQAGGRRVRCLLRRRKPGQCRGIHPRRAPAHARRQPRYGHPDVALGQHRRPLCPRSDRPRLGQPGPLLAVHEFIGTRQQLVDRAGIGGAHAHQPKTRRDAVRP